MKHTFSLLWALIFVAVMLGCSGCKSAAPKHKDASRELLGSVADTKSGDASGVGECKKSVAERIDADGDGTISAAEAERVVILKIEKIDADILLVLERFSNLERLEIRGVDTPSLALSKNTKLKHLVCCECNLTKLDLSRNVALEYVDCSSNQLTVLDVSKNAELDNLYCDYNPLKTLYLASGHKFGHLSAPEDTAIIYK